MNLKKMAVAAFNLALSAAFFFSWRRWLLNLIGADICAGVTIHRGVTFYSFGKFRVGKNSTINPWCLIDNRAEISIGDNVNISHNVKIYSMGHDIDDPACSVRTATVHIGNNAWVFPNSIIMPGVRLGTGAVVYPGSVVTKNVGDYEIWGGNPAKFLRQRNKEISYTARFPVWFGI